MIAALIRRFSKFHDEKDQQYLLIPACNTYLCRKVEYRNCFVSDSCSLIEFCNQHLPDYSCTKSNFFLISAPAPIIGFTVNHLGCKSVHQNVSLNESTDTLVKQTRKFDENVNNLHKQASNQRNESWSFRMISKLTQIQSKPI